MLIDSDYIIISHRCQPHQIDIFSEKIKKVIKFGVKNIILYYLTVNNIKKSVA